MSNPLRLSLNNITSVANAVKRTIENQKAHIEHRETKMQNQQIQEAQDLIAMEIEQAINDMLPAAEGILANKQDLPERGYFATHRSLGHLLPSNLKWTVMGVEVVNAVMARIPVTSPWLPKWEHDIAMHIEEVRDNMEKKAERDRKYEEDNIEVGRMVHNEIIRLFKTQDNIRRSYFPLLSYLRHGMPKGFQGSRGVKIINTVIADSITYSTYWKENMDKALAEAVERDRQYHEAKKAQNNYQNR